MPIADQIKSYSVSIFQSSVLNYGRQIRLSLESGSSASIQFPEVRPDQWLQFFPGSTSLYMVQDQFTDVYHLLQSERPVFFTALDAEGVQVGAVHTQLDLGTGEPTGEGEGDEPYLSLEALIRRAQAQGGKPSGIMKKRAANKRRRK